MRLSRFQLALGLVALSAVAALAVFLIRPSTLLTDEVVVAWPSPAKLPTSAARPAMQASTAVAGSDAGDALPAMAYRQMAKTVSQERDLYAWFHRMLKQEPPSAAQVSLMRDVLAACESANQEAKSRTEGVVFDLAKEMQFRCSGFSTSELNRSSRMIQSYAAKLGDQAEKAYNDKRCEDLWRMEQQYEWLPKFTAGCLTPSKEGRVATLFGSQHNLALTYAFFLELSLSEWGARDGMAPSQMHTMQLAVCLVHGYACGTPSQQLAEIQYLSEEGNDAFPMSEIDRMRPLIREYLRHPDLSIVGSAPEQPKVLRRPKKPETP